MKVHAVSPPEFTKLDCKNSTTIITRVQRELVSSAVVVGQIGYQGSLGGPPMMTSGRLSLPSTPINPGVPTRSTPEGCQEMVGPRQPLHRPAHHVQHLNTTHGPPSGQVGRPSQEWTEDTRVGVPRRRRVGPTHPPTRPRRARDSLPDSQSQASSNRGQFAD